MKKRIVAALLIICLLTGSALAAGSLSNFSKVTSYSGQFTDISASQWYADEVRLVYEYGLINGKTETAFEPDSLLTLAEAIKLAAVMHSIYNTGTSTLQNGDPWYQPYVDYALNAGIIPSGYANYNAYATRSDFATIFANAFPEEALAAINTIDADAIPDVSFNYSYGPAVYLLYRAGGGGGGGVLTGSGDNHAFLPNNTIKRSGVAAIAARMVDSSFRVAFSIAAEESTAEEPASKEPTVQELTATQIAAQCSSAVFCIVVYDGSGEPLGLGSGFFIDSSGLAITNHHVIEGASSAAVLTTDGEVYDVAGVYDSSKDYDLALLQVDGGGFSYLPVGDSDEVVMGETVYAIGNPEGLTNTFSQGIVSNAARQFSDTPVRFIQFDASISHGSSGGALVNTRGQAVGVTSASLTEGQNLNLAVPINLIRELSRDSLKALSSFAPVTTESIQVSSANVSVSVGGRINTTVTDPSGNPDYVFSCYIEDISIATCFWGDFTDSYSCPLYIEGISPGQTRFTVYLEDKNGNELASKTITVNVTGSGTRNIPGYSSFSGVPDYGAYTGTPLFKVYYVVGMGDYQYRLTDIPVNSDIAFYGYMNLLEDSGFSYTGYETNDRGYAHYYFENDMYWISLGIIYIGSDLYMQVFIVP